MGVDAFTASAAHRDAVAGPLTPAAAAPWTSRKQSRTHLVEEPRAQLVEDDPQAVHREAVEQVTALAQTLAPTLTSEQLGGLAAAVRSFRDDPTKVHDVYDQLTALYHANPDAKAQLGQAQLRTATPALGAVAARYQRHRPAPSAPPRVAPERARPAPIADDGRGREQVRRMVADREGRVRSMEEFYRHPDYQRDLAGDPDSRLSEDYLTQRRALFGKRRWRRR